MAVDADARASDQVISTHTIHVAGSNVLEELGVVETLRAVTPASPALRLQQDDSVVDLASPAGRAEICPRRYHLDGLLQNVAVGAACSELIGPMPSRRSSPPAAAAPSRYRCPWSRPSARTGLASSKNESRPGPAWTGAQWQDLVFADEAGGPLSGFHVTKRFRRLLVTAGLPDMRYHDLRHAAASPMSAPGIAARTVMETLGHSDIAVTMNVYTHVLPDAQRDAAARMGRVLWPNGVSLGSELGSNVPLSKGTTNTHRAIYPLVEAHDAIGPP